MLFRGVGGASRCPGGNATGDGEVGCVKVVLAGNRSVEKRALSFIGRVFNDDGFVDVHAVRIRSADLGGNSFGLVVGTPFSSSSKSSTSPLCALVVPNGYCVDLVNFPEETFAGFIRGLFAACIGYVACDSYYAYVESGSLIGFVIIVVSSWDSERGNVISDSLDEGVAGGFVKVVEAAITCA